MIDQSLELCHRLVQTNHGLTILHQIFILLLLIIFYAVYRYAINGITFKLSSKNDLTSKNIGRPLPSFPNGWYVVMHREVRGPRRQANRGQALLLQ